MKRRLLILGVFLLLGAVVNVAVAWGCACYSPAEVKHGGTRPTWPMSVPAGWPARPRYSFDHIGSGMSVHLLEAHGPEPTGRWTGDRFEGPTNADLYRCYWLTAGLPSRSMQWHFYDVMRDARGTLDHWPSDSRGVVASGLNAPHFRQDEWMFFRQLPLRPIWPGFAVNMFFYAALLWLPFAGSGHLRRRRRAAGGFCPACAYPVGASPVCTECGRPVTPVSVEPVA